MTQSYRQSELDEILARHNCELGVTWEDPDVVTPDTKQAITSLIKELVAEARIDGAIMGAKFGNAAFRQYNVAGKPINLDEIRDVGIKQAEDWAKRQC